MFGFGIGINVRVFVLRVAASELRPVRSPMLFFWAHHLHWDTDFPNTPSLAHTERQWFVLPSSMRVYDGSPTLLYRSPSS